MGRSVMVRGIVWVGLFVSLAGCGRPPVSQLTTPVEPPAGFDEFRRWVLEDYHSPIDGRRLVSDVTFRSPNTARIEIIPESCPAPPDDDWLLPLLALYARHWLVDAHPTSATCALVLSDDHVVASITYHRRRLSMVNPN